MFYIDLFMEQNFLMNLIVLSLTYIFCKNPVSMRYLRMVLAAFCGTVSLTLLLVFGPGYGWSMAGHAFVLVPAMIYVAYGWNGKRSFIIRIGISWLSIVLLDGVAEALQNITGLRTIVFYASIAVLLVARVLTCFLIRAVGDLKRMFPVILYQGDKSVRCLGLYDTGNLLSMPNTGEMVHIVSGKLLARLGAEDTAGLQLIPYRALGTQEGWIRVVQLDKLEIHMGREQKIYRNVRCGVAEEVLFQGKSYQVILHSGV